MHHDSKTLSIIFSFPSSTHGWYMCNADLGSGSAHVIPLVHEKGSTRTEAPRRTARSSRCFSPPCPGHDAQGGAQRGVEANCTEQQLARCTAPRREARKAAPCGRRRSAAAPPLAHSTSGGRRRAGRHLAVWADRVRSEASRSRRAAAMEGLSRSSMAPPTHRLQMRSLPHRGRAPRPEGLGQAW